ncbi:hypothetical protein FRC03_010412 [Tulasnella sp. 419]|nr:hypothetical protein FRC03_010412 [Tulasnella sp. 419]
MAACERVLGTPELMSYIIGLVDTRKDQVSAAQTCHLWSEHAFHWIWRELDSLIPLFNLLAPLERREADSWAAYNELYFPENMTFDKWPRLVFYGKYVRSIGFMISEEDEEFEIIEPKVYRDIKAASLNLPAFLPNLQHCEWTFWDSTCRTAIDLMVSPSVTQLQLNMEVVEDPCEVSEILTSLHGRVPDLRMLSLSLEPSIGVEDVEQPLATLLSTVPRLEQLYIPHFFHSEKIVATLRSLSRLEVLDCSGTAEYKSIRNDRGCQLGFEDDSFRSLQLLSCNTSLKKASHQFLSRFAPNNLSSIYIKPKLPTLSSDLQDFLSALVSSNPNLIDVNLNLYSDSTVPPVEIEFKDLQSLLQLPLKQLAISHDKVLSYSAEDVVVMGCAWPNMQGLYLTEEPLVSRFSPSHEDLTMLSLFAEHFPQLEDLGVFLHIGDNLNMQRIPRPHCRFRQLKELHVGTSPLPEAHQIDVAFYLASIMANENTDLCVDYSTWYPSIGHQRRVNSAWFKVHDLMKALYRNQLWLMGGSDFPQRSAGGAQRSEPEIVPQDPVESSLRGPQNSQALLP